MKKFNIKCILALAIILLCALLLCSCNSFEKQLEKMSEEERAQALTEKAIYNQDNASSYISNSEMMIDVSCKDADMSILETGEQIIYGASSDEDYYHYCKYKVTSNKTTRVTTMGYADGKMFESDGASFVYSPLPKKDYLDYLSIMDDIGDTSHLNPPKSITAEKNEDGYWVIEFSQFDTELINFLCANLFEGIDTYYYRYFDVTDIFVTLTINSEYQPDFYSIKLVHTSITYDDSIFEPIVEYNVSFSNYNQVKENELVEIDFSKYKNVSDLRLFHLMEKELYKAIDWDTGRFSSSVTTSASQNGNTSSFSYSYSGTYENNEDGFRFQLISRTGENLNSPPATISYEYNSYKEAYGTSSRSTEMSDFEAKARLSSILIPVPISINDLVTCNKVGAGDNVTYNFAYSSIDPSLISDIEILGSPRVTLSVAIKGGKVAWLSYSASGITESNQAISISVKNFFQ